MPHSVPLSDLVSQRPPGSRQKLQLMKRVQLFGWLVLALVLCLATVAPTPEPAETTGLLAIAAFAVAFAILLGVAPQSWPLNRISVFVAVLAISGAVALAQPPGAGRLLYLWPVLSATQFLGRRELIAAVALLAATLLPALVVADPDAMAFMYAMTVLTAVVVAVMQRLAVEQLQRLMHKLGQAAITDSLTGLLDRRGFLGAIDRDLERARRADLPVTLAQFDLDRFKTINDDFGHAAGDDVLAEFARMLEGECRAADIPGRIGGEEFAVLLFDADQHSGRRFAQRVASRLEAFSAPGGVPLTVSAGVAVADPSATPEQLLWAADGAVYEAKAQGRDRIVVVQPEPAAAAA